MRRVKTRSPATYGCLSRSTRASSIRARGGRFIKVYGRLKPEVTVASAGADMARLADSFFTEFPNNYKRETGYTMFVESMKSYNAGKAGLILSLLVAAVTLVLLAACA